MISGTACWPEGNYGVDGEVGRLGDPCVDEVEGCPGVSLAGGIERGHDEGLVRGGGLGDPRRHRPLLSLDPLGGDRRVLGGRRQAWGHDADGGQGSRDAAGAVVADPCCDPAAEGDVLDGV